jgi:hypothetical protein
MDTLRYLAWSELRQAPTTDGYLAELERMLRVAAREGGGCTARRWSSVAVGVRS